MTRNAVPRDATFGYLSTWDTPEHGCVGGYLIVSQLGRPLEFHCTAPVRPSRAQQILYGATLWPYLLGDQIGGRLVREAKIRPRVVLIDHPATFFIRSQIGIPMLRPRALGEQTAKQGEAIEIERNSDSMASSSAVAGTVFEFAPGYASDVQAVAEELSHLARYVDLIEPFTRIHDAIREAHRLGASDEVPRAA
jgi:hypothetical protein